MTDRIPHRSTLVLPRCSALRLLSLRPWNLQTHWPSPRNPPDRVCQNGTHEDRKGRPGPLLSETLLRITDGKSTVGLQRQRSPWLSLWKFSKHPLRPFFFSREGIVQFSSSSVLVFSVIQYPYPPRNRSFRYSPVSLLFPSQTSWSDFDS